MIDRETYCKDCDRSIYAIGELARSCDMNVEDNGYYNLAGEKCYCKIINHQNTEIERLGTNNLSMQKTLSKMSLGVEQARAEAIKEFWEKLKEKKEYEFLGEGWEGYIIHVEDGDSLVKEMIGGNND